MIFIWGEKSKRKALGHVAELCHTCREIRTHQLLEVREIPHVYYVPLGRGKIAQYQIDCGQCDLATVVDPSRYAAVLDEEIALEKLIELTNPGVLAELEEKKDREERALRRLMDPEERVQVMIESLYPVVVAVEERVTSRSIDGRTGLLMLATLVLSGGLFALGLNPDEPELGMTLLWASAGAAGLGVIAMIHAGMTNTSRFIRRTQGAAIQAALQQFHPSPAELNSIVDELRAAGMTLGKKLDASWLTDLFHSVRAVSA